MKSRVLLFGVLAIAACAPKRVHEDPIMKNGDRVHPADEMIETARTQNTKQAGEMMKARDSVMASALSKCQPEVCKAIARGEIALGMTELQVMAATRTTEAAWAIRDAGDATVMVPASVMNAPHDASGEVALLQLSNGAVTSYSYREAQGVRVVANARDATTAGRASALADMLLRAGDDLVARGDFNGALNRYDRAQVLRANDAQIDYRIATVLDKELRPVEALIRYQLFLHKLEIEKIRAQGESNAQLATAIAYAKERIIVLEKRK